MVTSETNNLEPSLTFEGALVELDEIVRKLEGGNISIDDSIKLYKRGSALKNFCDEKLKEAKMKVEKIVSSQDGSVNLTVANFDD